MNHHQGAIVGMIFVGALSSIYGEIAPAAGQKTKPSLAKTVTGSFVVLIVLLALAQSDTVAPIATAFAFAYMASSFLVNGNSLITGVSNIVSNPPSLKKGA